MPTTGAPWNIWSPDDQAALELDQLFATMATSVHNALNLGTERVPTVADRDAKVVDGTFTAGKSIYLVADSSIQHYNGTKWVIFDTKWRSFATFLSGSSGTFSVGSGGRKDLFWRYEGDIVRIRFSFVFGTGGFMSTQPTFTLPVPAEAPIFSNQIFNGIANLVDLNLASIPGLVRHNGTSTTVANILSFNGAPGGINSSTPWAWGTGDGITGDFTYRIA